MSFRVQLTAEALRNQNEMADWIMQRSVAGALAWLDALDRVLRQVSTSPLSFPIAAEDEFSHQELRNALFGTRKGRVFRAIFFVDGDRVIVTHLRGPAQQALSYDGKRPGILFVPTAFRFTDPLRGGGQRRRFCRGDFGDRRVCGWPPGAPLQFDAPARVSDEPQPSGPAASRSWPHLAVDWPVTFLVHETRSLRDLMPR